MVAIVSGNRHTRKKWITEEYLLFLLHLIFDLKSHSFWLHIFCYVRAKYLPGRIKMYPNECDTLCTC